MSSGLASIEHYDRDAARFGALYSQSRFEDVHKALLPHLPPMGSEVLDIGAGSGRDAAALAQMGYVVTAVEPSSELRSWSQHHYGSNGIEWIEDRLPALATLRSSGRRYDFILCSAVLIHIAPGDLPQSLVSLASLLMPGARLAISVRNRQADDSTDIFHDVPDQTLIEAATYAGLSLQQQSNSADQLGRDVCWRAFVFVDSASTEANKQHSRAELTNHRER